MPQSPEIMPMTGQEMPEPSSPDGSSPDGNDGKEPLVDPKSGESLIEDLRSEAKRRLDIGQEARQEAKTRAARRAKNAPPTNPPGSRPLVDPESGESLIEDLRSPLDRGQDIVRTARETAGKAQKTARETAGKTAAKNRLEEIKSADEAALRDEFNNLPDSLPERQEFIKKVIEHLAANDTSLGALFPKKGMETEPSTDDVYKAELDAFVKKYANNFLGPLNLNIIRGSTYENTVEILRSLMTKLIEANKEISAKQHQAAVIAAALAEQPRPAAPEAAGQEPVKKPGLFKRLASWFDGKKTT